MKNSDIKKHAFILLMLMSGLYFISFFQRVAVPGTIFNEIQRDFAASASAVTALSSIYLYVYAGMQLFVGMMADRHGGIRVILVSGCFLCLGSLIFPLSGQIWTLYLSRALVGFGASGMYLCIIKETDSFFGGKNFAPMIGFFCMIGYGGGLCGTRPFRMMVDWTGWRTSLLLVGIFAVILLIMTYFTGRKLKDRHIMPHGHSLFKRTGQVIINRRIYPVLISGMINFSIYFSMQATIGPKFIGDFLKLEPKQAAEYTFIMMIFTMSTMLTVGVFSRMIGNRRKPFLILASLLTLIAVTILLAGVIFRFSSGYFMMAFILMSISSGLFPVITSLVKELNAPDITALSIGVQNTMSYIAVAFAANMIGFILDFFRSGAVLTSNALVYPPRAYLTVFAIMFFCSLISFISSLHCWETRGECIYGRTP
ncbi:MAG: hypothetical protein A2017_22340 [Lentisphaerae bacterium GWF2_44_16]|nr:MAG: hypothetical protein A2017_22340 [Lentisphaerae bacterium GWF2_44_16]